MSYINTTATAPYLVALDLADAPVLVVGAGTVATRKVSGLVEAGARVTVIAPAASESIQDLSRTGHVVWERRPFAWSDLAQPALLTFAATNDEALNARISAAARERHRLVNDVSPDGARNFWNTATAHAGGVSVAVTTGGASVTDALSWRDHFAQQLPRRADAITQPGSVVLAGAGPGDTDLLTVGARRALEEADVVVYDRLAGAKIVDLAPPHAQRIGVGKDPFGDYADQNEINRILIEKAREGLRVVRLKGGDPFVFGRGTEEIEALADAGIAFRVIPGISSVLGVAGSVGVALTARGRNHGFTVISGAPPTTNEDLRSFAAAPGPVAIVMGVRRAADIEREFVAAGRSTSEPVTVIARGTTAGERIAEITLGELAATLSDAKAWTPALIVIGVHREAAFAARDAVGAGQSVRREPAPARIVTPTTEVAFA
jgi:uroporphyrin-III C-methyltransferase/precorrin-2 dehydrogenase/sirohydrochlorin ferrochelatase